jgi:polar amino acid transport system substrate-binding protein
MRTIFPYRRCRSGGLARLLPLMRLAALLLACPLPAASAQPQPTPPPEPGSAPLRVVTRVVPPFVFEDNGKLTGFSIDLWQSIAKEMGVETQFLVKPDILDLLAAVKSGEGDVGIAAISITAERDEAFDFTQPMFESGLQIMVREVRDEAKGREGPIRGLLSLLLSPVMLEWLGIVLLFILAPAHIVWIAERRHKEGIIPSEAYFPGIFHAAWWAAGTLATQADIMPRSALARLMAVLWMFTGVVFVAYFTASVTASLTIQQLKGSIRGPDDLPGLHVATTTGSTSVTYLREHRVRIQEFSQIDKAFTALLREEVDAVVFDAPVLLYYAASLGKGKVQVVGSEFNKENYGIVCRINSPYRKRMDAALLTLRENGTYDRLYDKWFSSR